jgi:hypothetical protein
MEQRKATVAQPTDSRPWTSNCEPGDYHQKVFAF